MWISHKNHCRPKSVLVLHCFDYGDDDDDEDDHYCNPNDDAHLTAVSQLRHLLFSRLGVLTFMSFHLLHEKAGMSI